MSKSSFFVKVSMSFLTASSLFTTAQAATTTADVLVTVASSIALSKTSDLNFGTVSKHTSDCVYTYEPSAPGTAATPSSNDSTNCIWSDTSNRSLAIFNMTCADGVQVTSDITYATGSVTGVTLTAMKAITDSATDRTSTSTNPTGGDVGAIANCQASSSTDITFGGQLTVSSTATAGSELTVGTITVLSNY